jgi:transcriptional regulator with XRE-family HTH domain
MSPREAFGPNLRRIRLQRGISLEQIARETKVSVSLWDALERNDVSRWPTGIFARGFVREYARIINVDAEATVDEFCRWFAQGDRRALRVVREHAEIVGHQLEWQEALPTDAEIDRRGAPSAAVRPVPRPTLGNLLVRLRRAFGKA